MARNLGLDRPYHVQLGTYLLQVIQGDFGVSLRQNRPAMELVLERLPNSGRLALVSIVMALVMSLVMGVSAAVWRNRPVDQVIRFLTGTGQALPSFWLGIMLILLFSVWLEVLPVAGMGTIWHYILPSFSMAWFLTAGMTRLLRSTMIEELDSEYVRFVRSKGVSEWAVIWKHALRNSLIPLTTFGALYLSLLITMAVAVESIFNWPGVGSLAYEAIRFRDFSVIQATVLTGGALVVLINILVDIQYAFLDPRIRVMGAAR